MVEGSQRTPSARRQHARGLEGRGHIAAPEVRAERSQPSGWLAVQRRAGRDRQFGLARVDGDEIRIEPTLETRSERGADCLVPIERV